MKRWFVICLDDCGKYTFATTRHFASEEDAEQYKGTVAAARAAMVVYSTKDIPNVLR